MSNNLIEFYHKKIDQCWDLAKIQDFRIKSGIYKLKKFSLWKRLFFYTKFNKIRSIIYNRKQNRFMAVALAIGISKKVRHLEKQQRSISKN